MELIVVSLYLYLIMFLISMSQHLGVGGTIFATVYSLNLFTTLTEQQF